MTNIYLDAAELLLRIEMELRRLDMWEIQAPSPADLSSPLPFSHDTLRFTQWLQFIFLVRMRELIEGHAPLPTECAIAPYAEEYFKGMEEETAALQALLVDIDRLLTSSGR